MLRTRFRAIRPLALVLAAALALTACGGGSTGGGSTGGGSTPVEGGIVTIAQLTAPSGTFNPWVTTQAYDANITALIYEGLLRLNEKLEWVPNLAESYQVSEDGRTITFRLKEGIVWSDGKPITSEDVRFTFEQVMHPEYPGPSQSNVAFLRGGQELLAKYDELRSRLEPEDPAEREEGKQYITREQFAAQTVPLWEQWLQSHPIETPDERTVVLHFDEPYAPALETFGGGAILPKHVFESIPVRDWTTAEPTQNPPVASGPYTFVKYVRDQYTELARNPKYHLGVPKVEKVIFRVIQGEVAVGALQKGEIDALGVGASQPNPKDLDLIKTFQNVDIWENPDFGYQYMGLNLKNPFLAIKEVRQALAYAIDREGLVKQLLNGHGTVMNTVFLPMSWAYDAQGLNPYPYDPEKARQLLAQAGFADTDGDGVLEKDGKPFRMTLAYPGGTSNPVRQASAPLIQAYLKAVGIQVDLEPVDFSTLVSRVTNTPENPAPKYDMWLMGWSLTVDPDQTGLWAENDLYNMTRWSRATVGDAYDRSIQLIQDGVKTFDQEQRKQIYRELGRIFNEQLPYVFLYTQNTITVFNKRVKDVNRDIRGATENAHQWWIPKEMQ